MGKQVAARLYGGVAQLGEHLPCKQGVKSSNLSISINRQKCRCEVPQELLKLPRSGCDCTLKTSYREIIDLFFKENIKTSEK